MTSLASALRFYSGALGLAADPPHDGRTLLRAGEQVIELVETQTQQPPAPIDGGSTDVRFQHMALVTHDMAAAVARLQAQVPLLRAISDGGPHTLQGAAAGITAFKFRDPDGHPVELLSFAPAVMPPAWQGRPAPGGAIVGLDHAALSVSDTARSVAFYRDVLGLRLAHQQVNRGAEQARLDGLAASTADGAVEVTSLSPAVATPHVELLCCRPRGGMNAAPLHRAPRSVLADVLVLQVAPAVLVRAHRWATGSVAGLPRDTAQLAIDDPDGHRLLLWAGP